MMSGNRHSRITASAWRPRDRTPGWRSWSGALALLVTVAACGSGSSSPTPPPSTPATPEPAPPSKPTVVLGRPTDVSIVAVVKGDAGTELYLEYGATSGAYTGQSATTTLPSNGLALVRLDGLKPDAAYVYRTRYRAKSATAYLSDAERAFHTRRLAVGSFTFVVQADPHMDANSSAAVYSQTLANELADKPDFMVDLGDTSMVEKCAIDGSSPCAAPSPKTQETVLARYAAMRTYFDVACHSVPLFMVLGNHDGETGWPDPSASDLDGWALAARKALFANPEPDGFYSGNTELRQDYYAFEWGDALFVALDPFTYTPRKPGSDGWGWTLGTAQYNWLAQTLAGSRARFKFVFSHHLLGGNGSDARGGAAFGRFFEWGGRNLDGTWAFDKQRPGWGAPIHQLLVDNKVTAWFHGHDHLYAQESLDGVIYQEVPQPSLARYDTPNPGGDYGYLGTVGTNIFASSGHLRVTVGPTDVRVEYVRSVAPADVTPTRQNGSIVTSYVVR
jgi:hypothetical protein